MKAADTEFQLTRMSTRQKQLDSSTGLRTASAASGPRTISSGVLLGGERELRIEHAGELYSLRQTSKGKLILTK